MEERDIKRMTILVPQDLYERFLECNKNEYKTNTAIIVEWISKYVKEKESKAEREKVLLRTISRVSEVISDTQPLIEESNPARSLLADLSATLLALAEDGDLLDDPAFEDRLSKLEREIVRKVRQS
jgi:predicted DNA-binding protein